MWTGPSGNDLCLLQHVCGPSWYNSKDQGLSEILFKKLGHLYGALVLAVG